RHARLVRGEARKHELVKVPVPAELDQVGEQDSPDTLATPLALDVHGDVGHVVVTRPRIEDVEAGPAHGLDAAHRDHGRVGCAPRGQPAAAFVHIAQLRLERGHAVLDALVVDRADGGGVVQRSGANGHGLHELSSCVDHGANSSISKIDCNYNFYEKF